MRSVSRPGHLPTDGAITAVVVSYSDPAATRVAVQSLLAQTHRPLEVLVVDNAPDNRFARQASEFGFDALIEVIAPDVNLGYTGAANLAGARACGDWIFFLNPDAQAEPTCLARLLEEAQPDTAVLGAQVLLPDGRVNAGHNPLHLTGISWAGRYGELREPGPAREVAAVSGAALLARAAVFRDLGGLCERFFLYQDDSDFCWRARVAGRRVRFCPEAIVRHDYEFDKGRRKWFWLQRNRLWSVFANYSSLSLGLLAPLLLGAELAVAVLAVRDGWVSQYARAWLVTVRSLPALWRWRCGVQTTRQTPDSEIMRLMTSRFGSALVDSPAVVAAGPLLAAYGAAVRWTLRRAGS
jgi:GT2 family glycosyltransferase